MKIQADKGLKQLQLFGHSKILMDWVNNQFRI
jgi:hypothetical protein